VSDDLPEWLRTLAKASETVEPAQLSRFVPPEEPSVRDSAVLILMADDGERPDVLLTERAWTLRSHAGQMSFPGGRVDPSDGEGAEAIVNAALREGQEETGLDPAGVHVFAVWPALWVPVSNFASRPRSPWSTRPRWPRCTGSSWPRWPTRATG
jgi:8-oxo-dGTP pyrophosphatase MutT (NUDIX family)